MDIKEYTKGFIQPYIWVKRYCLHILRAFELAVDTTLPNYFDSWARFLIER